MNKQTARALRQRVKACIRGVYTKTQGFFKTRAKLANQIRKHCIQFVPGARGKYGLPILARIPTEKDICENVALRKKYCSLSYQHQLVDVTKIRLETALYRLSRFIKSKKLHDRTKNEEKARAAIARYHKMRKNG